MDLIEGSVATFRCELGPDMTAMCTASGEWVPNPGDLSCSQPPGQGNVPSLHTVHDQDVNFTESTFCPATATCGDPPSPASGSVDFTNVIEGSLATFRCPEMTAVCTANGEWVPNPGDLSCSLSRGQGIIKPKCIIGISLSSTCMNVN